MCREFQVKKTIGHARILLVFGSAEWLALKWLFDNLFTADRIPLRYSRNIGGGCYLGFPRLFSKN